MRVLAAADYILSILPGLERRSAWRSAFTPTLSASNAKPALCRVQCGEPADRRAHRGRDRATTGCRSSMPALSAGRRSPRKAPAAGVLRPARRAALRGAARTWFDGARTDGPLSAASSLKMSYGASPKACRPSPRPMILAATRSGSSPSALC